MALELRYEPLSDLLRAPRNPKDHDIGFLHRSMGRWGFTDPVLVDERTGRLVAGHGRLDTLKAKREAGEAPPENVQRRKDDGEWLVPVIRGWSSRSDIDAEAYLVADNRATELGGWESAELAQILSEHADDIEDLGFSTEELEALLREVDPSVAIEWKEYDEDIAKEVKRVECPECGHEFPV